LDLSFSLPVYSGFELTVLTTHPYPWQLKINAMLSYYPGDRNIIWIVDPIGGSGKSYYNKWLCYHKKAVLISWESPREALYVRSRNMECPVCVVDLTRTLPSVVDLDDLYSTLESVKNGHFNSTKYEPKTYIGTVPHVVVFSNSLPTISKMTYGRFITFLMTPKKDLMSLDFVELLDSLLAEIKIYKISCAFVSFNKKLDTAKLIAASVNCCKC
jgi:hypothetical protein